MLNIDKYAPNQLEECNHNPVIMLLHVKKMTCFRFATDKHDGFTHIKINNLIRIFIQPFFSRGRINCVDSFALDPNLKQKQNAGV